VVHVYADDGVGTGRCFGLFANELQLLVFTEDWHTQVAQVPGLVHALQQDPATTALVLEIRYVRRDPLAKNVIGKHHNDFVTINESLAEAKRFRDAAGVGLIAELQSLESEFAAVPEQRQELTGVVTTRDDH